MRSNIGKGNTPSVTYEGALGVRANTPIKELRRRVLNCMLFEDTFYESGSTIADEMKVLISKCKPIEVAELVVEAREKMYLRHVPLFLVRELARNNNGALIRQTLRDVIQRPDEITEYLALYYKDDKDSPLSNASRKGLADAFKKFNRYSLAKYRGESNTFSLKDALCLVRPKPNNTEQNNLWKELRNGTLRSFDTWEVELSAGKDKKETFERLISENKLGGLAFLRNLRNMEKADVDRNIIRARFNGNFDKVLPFRFITASRYSPTFGSEISDAMLRVCNSLPRISGRTAVVVDVSGSMVAVLSAKTEVTRMDAACGMAVLMRELCTDCDVFSFSDKLVQVTGYRGLPLVDGILRSQMHSGTYLGQALELLPKGYDRIVVITDEQSHDRVIAPPCKNGYIVNVAPYAVGVVNTQQNTNWALVNGRSERLLDWIVEYEKEEV